MEPSDMAVLLQGIRFEQCHKFISVIFRDGMCPRQRCFGRKMRSPQKLSGLRSRAEPIISRAEPVIAFLGCRKAATEICGVVQRIIGTCSARLRAPPMTAKTGAFIGMLRCPAILQPQASHLCERYVSSCSTRPSFVRGIGIGKYDSPNFGALHALISCPQSIL